MSRLYKTALRGFALLYLGALAIGLIGTFGWFGQEKDPLAWIFIVPLGLPWTLMLGVVGDGAAPWLGAAAPALNLFILAAIGRRFSKRNP